MPVATPRRLAGFSFEDRTPPVVSVLPRMDITAFVGFASSGPLHLPVAVESLDRFNDLFGDDLPLAWDGEAHREQNAFLAPCVRSFFVNGGRRCWIVRVANAAVAETSAFAVPGLLRVDSKGKQQPACAYARAPGGWADSLRVSTSLLADPLTLPGFEGLTDGHLLLPPSGTRTLVIGDLIRIQFFTTGWTVFFPVNAIASAASVYGDPTALMAVSNSVSWFRSATDKPAPAEPGTASFADPTGAEVTYAATFSTLQPGSATSLDLLPTAIATPALGAWLKSVFAEGILWLRVDDLAETHDDGSVPQSVLRVTGEAWWAEPLAPDLTTLGEGGMERLTLELDVAEDATESQRLTGLGFTPDHPLFWAGLPTDAGLFAPDELQPSTPPPLWRLADAPRFPLAGPDDPAGVFLPLGIHIFATNDTMALHSGHHRLQREGLADFSADLFLDPDLRDVGTDALLGYADTFRFLSANPRLLRGLHAILPLDEVTLIATPDAVHLGWDPQPVPPIPEPLTAPPYNLVPTDPFVDCEQLIIPAPILGFGAPPDPSGSYTLAWSHAPADESWVLQEAMFPDFRDAVDCYAGPRPEITFLGRAVGIYYYQVRTLRGCTSSNWSNRITVVIAADARWLVRPPPAVPSAPVLHAVQRSLARLCAARADLVALLTLPLFARSEASLALAAQLQATVDPDASIPVRALGVGEARDWSYTVLYHPWLQTPSPGGDVTAVPPDGTLAGLYARLALDRNAGAWIAPANAALADPLALTPIVERSRWLELLVRQINVIRAEPTGVLCLSADTLSSDNDLRPVNVRRLLILLRRLALQLGNTYVFEANSDAFRRLVQHAFESALTQLFQRGAFAGNTTAEAFRVNTGSSVNTPASVDAGRLIVEIQVAPSHPMAFITIRLIQTNERSSVSEIS
jgi:hypothetical protein